MDSPGVAVARAFVDLMSLASGPMLFESRRKYEAELEAAIQEFGAALERLQFEPREDEAPAPNDYLGGCEPPPNESHLFDDLVPRARCRCGQKVLPE